MPVSRRARPGAVIAREQKSYSGVIRIPAIQKDKFSSAAIIPLVPWNTSFSLSREYKMVRFVSLELIIMNRRPATEGGYVFAWMSDPSIVKEVVSYDDKDIFHAWGGSLRKTTCQDSCIRVTWTPPNPQWIPNTSTAPPEGASIDKTRSAGELGLGFFGTSGGTEDRNCAIYQLIVTYEFKDIKSFADTSLWTPSGVPDHDDIVDFGAGDDLAGSSRRLQSPVSALSPPLGLGAPRRGIATIIPKCQMMKGYGIYESYYSGKSEPLDVGAMEFSTSVFRPSDGEGTTGTAKVKWPSVRWVADTQQIIINMGFTAVEDMRLNSFNVLQYAADWDPNEWYPGEYVYGKAADINITIPMRVKLYTVKEGVMTQRLDVIYAGGVQPRLSTIIRDLDLWAGEEVVIRAVGFSQHSSMRKERFVSWISYDHMWYLAPFLFGYESLRENKSPAQAPAMDFSALDALEEDCDSLEKSPVPSAEIEEEDD